MAKVNRPHLIAIVTKGMGNVAYSAARATAAQIGHDTKEMMLKEFDEHPVTQEVKAGPKASSSSGILKGIQNKAGESGNLFSFIGFHNGTDPTTPVREVLERYTVSANFKGKKEIDTVRGTATFKFSSYLPSLDEIEKAAAETTPSWMAGKSWINGVENGFDNLQYYLYRRKGFGPTAKSLSSTGLQVKRVVSSSARFKLTPYTTPILGRGLLRSTGVGIRGFGGNRSVSYSNYDKTFRGFFERLKGAATGLFK